MKSLADIAADNAEIEKRIEAKERASIRRLKQRIANIIHPGRRLVVDYGTIRSINAAIDAWAAKERGR